jgi:predicted CopG family antitoxin
MQIDIDFEVYKALTTMRRAEEHSYNDVLRELLSLPPREAKIVEATGISIGTSSALAVGEAVRARGLHSRGLFLPEGTELRAIYKGASYWAVVRSGVIENGAGETFGSPSAAAGAITETTVNGWRFWEAKRPNDLNWYRLDQLP